MYLKDRIDKIKTARRTRTIKQFYYINQYIRANQLRVVDENGKQLGLLSKPEALGEAQKAGMDLVLVAPNAKPPVAKVIDFAKFKFQQEKKGKISRKKSAGHELKEIRLSPFMAENDIRIRVEKAKKFLSGNDRVRFNVWFRGRQITRKQYGYDIMKKVRDELNNISSVEYEPKFRGRVLQMTLKPAKITLKKEKAYGKNKNAVSG